MTRTIEIAIPQYWSFDTAFLELYFAGLLRRSLPGTTIDVASRENNAYGGVGVITCDAAIASACNVAAMRINDAMQIRDPEDRFATLRNLAAEDRADRVRISKMIDDYFDEVNKEK